MISMEKCPGLLETIGDTNHDLTIVLSYKPILTSRKTTQVALLAIDSMEFPGSLDLLNGLVRQSTLFQAIVWGCNLYIAPT